MSRDASLNDVKTTYDDEFLLNRGLLLKMRSINSPSFSSL